MRRPSDRDLFFSFHLSGDLKEDFEFFKYMIRIILCTLDIDTVINKSKPQIPITSHLVIFNIRMSRDFTSTIDFRNFCPLPCALHPLVSALHFSLLPLAVLTQLLTWSCHKLHLRTDMQREGERLISWNVIVKGRWDTLLISQLSHTNRYTSTTKGAEQRRSPNFWHSYCLLEYIELYLTFTL